MHFISSTTKKELAKVQSTIKKELSKEAIIREIYSYVFDAEGKKTRALISLLASRDKSTNNVRRIELASVIELLHTATLVHDDVVDESSLRRGAKSVNTVWNNSYSVLMGDFIYSKAFILMVKINHSEILRELASATNDIAKGEILQLDLFKSNSSIQLKDLIKISYLKTGRLFEASARTGSMLNSKSSSQANSFGLLGKNLGIAFQIQDDILDYDALKMRTGKTPLKDFKEGKITFPLFFALESVSKRDRAYLLNRLGDEQLTKTEQQNIYNLVRSKEVSIKTHKLLNQYIQRTCKHLNALKKHAGHNEMLELIKSSMERKK